MYYMAENNANKNLTEVSLKGNYSLKRKKQPVRVIRENGCMLQEAATASYT